VRAEALAILAVTVALTTPGPEIRAGAAVTGTAPPSQTSSTPTSPAGVPVCTVDDPRAIELSGLVATAQGYVAVIDSQWDESQVVIVYLDQGCRVIRTQNYPTPARDPEDIAVAPDGTLWVADIGDNFTAPTHRQTVALWRLPSGGGPAVIYRLTYPDGWHDAEALLFDAAGDPVIVTKELADTAYVYRATGPLQPDTAAGVPLQRVGEFHPVVTASPNDLSRIGELLVTGAATSPDRRRIALRTYATAYEWDVPDGDVVKAITTGTPRITPLPDEPQGESIAYTPDGQYFLTCSDQSGPTTILRYRPSTVVEAKPSPPSSVDGVAASTKDGLALWYGLGLAGGGAAILIGAVGLFVGRRLRRGR
jgi:hypothetical protein